MDKRLHSVLTDFYCAVDAEIEVAEERYPVLRCPVDCNECCHTQSHFPVTVLEYLYVCEFVATHANQADRQRWRTASVALAQSDSGCPFAEGDRCRIYAARPSVCRFYGRTNRANGEANLCKSVRERLTTEGRSTEMRLPIVETLTADLGGHLVRLNHEMEPESLDRLLAVRPMCEYARLVGFAEEAVLDFCGIGNVR